MSSGPPVGTLKQLAGYCTHAFLLRGKTLEQLEDLLGYRRGRLASGATILFLKQMPGPDDFQLAGYSYFADGAVTGHKLSPADRDANRMESLLKSEHGWSEAQIRTYKQKMIGTKILVAGPERLAKLAPVTAHSPGDEYPPGQGVFQVKITRALPFEVKANIPPNQKWLGDYV